jgi:hypothetical protein
MTNIIDTDLTKIKEIFTSRLEVAVVESFEGNEDWKDYLLNVSKHGCISGIVSELIYYNDTINFHDEYEDEIDELVNNAVDSSGFSFSEIASSIDVWDIQQLKNWKSWFAYEEVVNQILNYLD